ncbi:MAG TPA: T9SS type A sorting domain-containing protein [bacterium]|nr:T9SS type A sorting domain-containing protein [bacterium]
MQFILSLTLLLSTGTSGVTPLRWMSPDSSKPLTHAEWRAALRPRPWRVSTLMVPCKLDSPRVDFFVQETLVSSLQQSLDTLVADLGRETTGVAVFSVSGTSAESLKALLTAEYHTGMTSAVLVGDLPIAWFQLIDDWNDNGVRDNGEGYEEFPCDLFFMDLDGTWKDSLARLADTLDSLVPGSDSVYDVHEGSITPEISVSRLPASEIGNAESLLVNYFDKNHRYRSHQLAVTDRALVYIDDDWTPWATDWDSNVGLLYHDRVLVSDSEQTRILDYQPRIDSAAYQWIALMSHSWPGGHAMYYDHKDSMDWFYATSIPSLDPHACFYDLFACSNVRFVESGYCGGRYVFQTSDGLSAIGSTKTGSMLNFGDFYSPLGQGVSLAEAFRQWFDAQLRDGCSPSERSWFYGMCLVADGTLRPRLPQTGIAEERRDMTEMSDISDRVPSLHLLTNPVRGQLNLNVSLRSPASCRVALFDLTGRVAVQLAPQAYRAGSHRLSLDASALPAGVYFISVSAGNSSARVPITVVR